MAVEEALLGAMSALHIGELEARQKNLAAKLRTFDLVQCAAALAGLLTLPAFQANTARIEALIHLVVLCCEGTRTPNAALLKEWLNDILLRDPVGNMEDPPEDVFTSNVINNSGNNILFEGIWEANAGYTQSALAALNHLAREGEEWAFYGLRQASALLRLSDAVAQRSGINRYTVESSAARQRMDFSSSLISSAASRVWFSVADLGELGIEPFDLTPFLFQQRQRDLLRNQSVIWTELERRPVMKVGDEYVLVLPTAVGAAVRRRGIELAVNNGQATHFDAVLSSFQMERYILPATRILKLDRLAPPCLDLKSQIIEVLFSADLDRLVQLLFVPDKAQSTHALGFSSVNRVDAVQRLIRERAKVVRAEGPFTKVSTWLIFGGLGRAISINPGQLPDNWSLLGIGFDDFELLASESRVNALTLLRILEQKIALEEQGTKLVNHNGFLNLYGFAKHQEFTLLPADAAPGHLILVGTDYLTDVRTSLRRSLDKHAVPVVSEGRFAEVERQSSEMFFEQLREEPNYASLTDALLGRFAAAVEASGTTWWLHLAQDQSIDPGSLHYRVWDMARNWLFPLTSALQRELPEFGVAFIDAEIRFSNPSEPDTDALTSDAAIERPSVEAEGMCLKITCSTDYLRSFGQHENIGDRWMIEALVSGALAVAEIDSPDLASAIAEEVLGGSSARHLHVLVPQSAGQAILATADLPTPRLIQAEVRAWAEVGLAHRCGSDQAGGGVLEGKIATKLLQDAVAQLWAEIRSRLLAINRQSVVELCLRMHDALDRDRSTWRHTAAALLVLHPQEETLRVATEQESQRADTSHGCRVVVEMAVCTCPIADGRDCTQDDLDQLLARVSLLTAIAARSDEIHHGFAHRIEVMPNGTFRFEEAFSAGVHQPYLVTAGKQQFKAAAANYAEFYAKQDDLSDEEYASKADPVFDAAFAAEFGVTPIRMADTVSKLASRALAAGSNIVVMSRADLLSEISSLDGVSVDAAEKLVTAWSLKPRSRWDETKPKGARAQDWWPWRHQRRLSVLARPFIEVDDGQVGVYVIAPVLGEHALHYALRAYRAKLPESFFRSDEMKGWIGAAIHKLGHGFNQRVAVRLMELGFGARPEVLMTALGGDDTHGDVDVLAWDGDTGQIFAIECKRLLADKTVGEIAERLVEYAPDFTDSGGKRGPTRKHLDRFEILKTNPDRLTEITGVPVDQQRLTSCLVTSALVPMQFQPRLRDAFDIIASFDQLDHQFGSVSPIKST